MHSSNSALHGDEIAIIGMTGRFPHANDLERLWQNLRDGHESVEFFSDKELIAAGVNPAVLSHPNFVKAGSVLEDIDLFDASFFGYSPREAELIDPQHRLFLENCWHALEAAGYDADTFPHRIGVYATVSVSSYILNLYSNTDVLSSTSSLQLHIGNEKDHFCARVAYKLNLRGPSVCVQTACSSSLVAVHMACQSLLNGECEMALAGGATVRVPQRNGYVYQEGGIVSPDGHCRAFDANAQGTVGGNGVGVVILKRLEDALADGDTIHAVIKGSAINNDGSHKVGYTAPSVQGQAEVIADAMAMARIDPSTISYVEAHGTGTLMGDPIEVMALTKAFRAATQAKNFCALGSAKSSLGHLDVAAGITGLIKTVLALKHGQLPPSLNFVEPNPQIDFANSPFYVNTKLTDWKRNGSPRRAGVSSFGVGGTNAHLILEEAPDTTPSDVSKRPQLLTLSAKTETALEKATENLADYLQKHSEVNLADVAYTLKVGRHSFTQRRAVVCRDAVDALHALQNPASRVVTGAPAQERASLAFMFPGQGVQYPNMTRQLYEAEPAFREVVDLCAEILKPHLGLDLREMLYPDMTRKERAAQQLAETAVTQPALFVIEYALAKLWMSWGVRPEAFIGHSIGEYVAACLAGVFTLEDALRLISARGSLMQEMTRGAMLAVSLPEAQVEHLLEAEISLAAVNAPAMCVVAGATEAVARLEQRLQSRGARSIRLQTSHAFHSSMMEPMLAAFAEHCKKVTLREPHIPYLSNVTGTWMTTDDALDANYWVRHLRQTVRFADGLRELMVEPGRVLLEVGPGETLCRLAKSQTEAGEVAAFGSLRGEKESAAASDGEVAQLLRTQGRLWVAGISIDWNSFYSNERRQRLPLPTYPFERQSYWVEPMRGEASPVLTPTSAKKELDEWFYLPSWKKTLPLQTHLKQDALDEQHPWLVFVDECGVGAQVVERLAASGQRVVRVEAGAQFAKLDEHAYTLNPQRPEDYETLVAEIDAARQGATKILHLWSVTQRKPAAGEREAFEEAQSKGFYSLLWLARALKNNNASSSMLIGVITNNMQDVTGEEDLCPEKSTILAACRVIPQEHLNINCRSIDFVLPATHGETPEQKLIEQLIAEMSEQTAELCIAYRGNSRWVQSFERLTLDTALEGESKLRNGGAYLITGGLGGVGTVLAEYLAKTVRARLVLTGRSAFPAREEWQRWLDEHDESDPVSEKIRKVQWLEELGAEVSVESADVADRQQMEDVLRRATERFGAINGVIHAAGNIGDHSFQSVQLTGREECEWQFQPKAYGVMVLGELLENRSVDFCMMVSSLSTVLGGFGLIAYGAANTYIDAYTQKQQSRRGLPWMTVNWDGWYLREAGEQRSAEGEHLAALAIKPEEGAAAFERLLTVEGAPQVVISTGDLATRIKQWVTLETVRGTVKKTVGNALRPRPFLQTEYVAPRNQVEKTLVEIWQPLFGIDRIGIRDNFFELGGHSLLALSMTAQIYERLGQEIPMAALFEEPTIEHLADVLNERGWPGVLKLVDKLPKVYSPLVKIRPGGAKQPFFFAAPLGGVLPSNVLVGVLDLARYLDAEQPFYGLQLPGLVQELGSLMGPNQPLDTTQLQTMFAQKISEKSSREMIVEGAAHCVRAIRHIQPHGPYMIGGFCTGGLVALEIAQNLREQGEEVSLLAMVDTNLPASSSRAQGASNGNGVEPAALEEAPDADADLDSIVWFVGRDLTGGQLPKDLPELKEEMRPLPMEERWAYALEQMKSINAVSPETTAEDIARLYMVYQVNVQTLGVILSNYTPNLYPGRITLFRSGNATGEESEDQSGGWSTITPLPVEFYKIPADHGTLFLEPGINALVDDLTRCLDRAQALAPGRSRDNGDKPKPTPSDADANREAQPGAAEAPPITDALILQLMDIWHDVLSRRPATLAENFFEVGGTRQQAVRLAERIRMRLGHSLSLSTIIQNPTIEQLVVIIYRARGWPWIFRVAHKQARIESPLITIQPEGMKRPFFFAAPLGGIFPSNVISGSILSLLPFMDPDRPYYGLQLPGLAQEAAAQLNFNRPLDAARFQQLFEQLPQGSQILVEGAAQCVLAIRDVQPEGPYLIGGFCTGGLLSLEIANQLRQQGEEVSLLALVDTFAPAISCINTETASGHDNVDSEVALFAAFISEVVGADRPPERLYEYLLSLDPNQRWQHALERGLARALVHPGEGVKKMQAIFVAYVANRQSLNIFLSNYAPSVYEGQIKMLACEDILREAPDAIKGWSRYSAEALDLRVIPAQHKTLFGEPDMHTLLQNLEDLFEEAERHCADSYSVTVIDGETETAGERAQPASADLKRGCSKTPRFVSRTVTLEDTYNYQVYLPANYTPDKKWPVILSLHGTGENGEDGLAPTRMGLGLTLRKNAWKHPCIVVMPQCRENRFWWDQEMEALAMTALEQTIREMNGDPQRVYLTGYSSGGFGAWIFAAKYSSKFAGLAAMGSPSPLIGTTDEENALIPQYYKNTPIWIFHGETDPIVQVGDLRKLVKALKDAGVSVRYTEYRDVGHGAWVMAYEDADFISWFLSQRLAG